MRCRLLRGDPPNYSVGTRTYSTTSPSYGKKRDSLNVTLLSMRRTLWSPPLPRLPNFASFLLASALLFPPPLRQMFLYVCYLKLSILYSLLLLGVFNYRLLLKRIEGS